MEVNELLERTNELKEVSGTEIPPRIYTFPEIASIVGGFLPNTTDALKLVLAVAVSCKFNNPVMLWLLLVGVPSSGKTELVRLIKDADLTFHLDNLTQNAFISGERETSKEKVHDLLPLVDQKCLVLKDWTSIFSLDEKMTKKLLGDLVNIYDKEFSKFSSRRGNISYASCFSQLGCITPATLNRHTNYLNMLGPRFLSYTMHTTSEDERNLSYELIFAGRDRGKLEKEVRKHVSSFLSQLASRTPRIKNVSSKIKVFLKTAAELMSNCRGIVIMQSQSFKNEQGDEIRYYDISELQIEEPWRAVQQLLTLSKYLAFISGKNEITEAELSIVKDVVISSMPADRSQALKAIKDGGGTITARMLTDVSQKSKKTSSRLLDALHALKVLDKTKSEGFGTPSTYTIKNEFKDFLLLDPAEFMSRGTETRGGIPTGLEESIKSDSSDGSDAEQDNPKTDDEEEFEELEGEQLL